MSLLQRVFDASNSAVGALDKRIKKNDDKMWGRIDKFYNGQRLVKKTGSFFRLAAPATYLVVPEGTLKGAFFAVRAASMKIAEKKDRPLDTAKLSKKLPRRSDRWTD